MEEVQSGAGVEAQPAALADGQIARVEQAFRATERFGRARERQQAGYGPDLELVLLARPLGVGIVEEVRSGLIELLGHVLERGHPRPDLAQRERTPLPARQIEGAELRL